MQLHTFTHRYRFPFHHDKKMQIRGFYENERKQRKKCSFAQKSRLCEVFRGEWRGKCTKVGVNENRASRMCKDFYTSNFKPSWKVQNGATSINPPKNNQTTFHFSLLGTFTWIRHLRFALPFPCKTSIAPSIPRTYCSVYSSKYGANRHYFAEMDRFLSNFSPISLDFRIFVLRLNG